MFFTAQGEAAAEQILDKYGLNSKYVMIDYAMATPAKFYAMAEWAGSSSDEFYQVYYVPVSTTELQPVALYYPAYYRSTVARLYNFDGEARVPAENSAAAISWERQTGQNLLARGYRFIVQPPYRTPIESGEVYRVVVGYQPFSSYEEAHAYALAQKSGNYDVGGLNPFSSIVSLEDVTGYELVYQSGDTTNSTTVKIFERIA